MCKSEEILSNNCDACKSPLSEKSIVLFGCYLIKSFDSKQLTIHNRYKIRRSQSIFQLFTYSSFKRRKQLTMIIERVNTKTCRFRNIRFKYACIPIQNSPNLIICFKIRLCLFQYWILD